MYTTVAAKHYSAECSFVENGQLLQLHTSMPRVVGVRLWPAIFCATKQMLCTSVSKIEDVSLLANNRAVKTWRQAKTQQITGYHKMPEMLLKQCPTIRKQNLLFPYLFCLLILFPVDTCIIIPPTNSYDTQKGWEDKTWFDWSI